MDIAIINGYIVEPKNVPAGKYLTADENGKLVLLDLPNNVTGGFKEFTFSSADVTGAGNINLSLCDGMPEKGTLAKAAIAYQDGVQNQHFSYNAITQICGSFVGNETEIKIILNF